MKKLLSVLLALFTVLFGVSFYFSRRAPEKLYLLLYGEERFSEAAQAPAPVHLKTGDYLTFGEFNSRPLCWRYVLTDRGPVLQCTKIIAFCPYDADSADWESSDLRSFLNTGDPLHLKELFRLTDGEVFLLSRAQLNKLKPSDREKAPTPEAIRNSGAKLLFLRKNCWYWTSSGISTTSLCACTVTQAGAFYKTPVSDPLTGLCPALRLRQADQLILGGSGSAENPYVPGVEKT